MRSRRETGTVDVIVENCSDGSQVRDQYFLIQAGPGQNESAPTQADSAAVPPDDENWKMDAHWTAVSAYLAEMYLPNEG